MTINSFLQNIEIGDHETDAKYPDGSGGKDDFALFIFMDGHGKVLNARVNKTIVNRGMMYILADGEK